MGTISTGIGLISGINTASLIEQLIALEARGKIPLQRRVASLQSQQAALLDINARLLALKTAAAGFRLDRIFDSSTATSSDDAVLTATAKGAQPGTYTFLVQRLVATSQKLSRAYAADNVPLGLTQISFELGAGRVSRDTALSELNGGQGVSPGSIEVTVGQGAGQVVVTVDLSGAKTVDDVLEALNTATGLNLTASVAGDHFVIRENNNLRLRINDAAGSSTATDLGIRSTTNNDNEIVGGNVSYLTGDTLLSRLNDGTGVYIARGNDDLLITPRDGAGFGVDLGRLDNPITPETLIEDLNDGEGVTLNADSSPDIAFTDRTGQEHEVDLTGIVTVAQLLSRVESQTGGAITISIQGGSRLVVTDTTGGTGLLRVRKAGSNGTATAEDLGILQEDGVSADTITGDILQNADHTPAVRTVQELLDRINDDPDNGGRITASIAPDGVSLRITSTVGGPSNLKVEGTAANPWAARDLGIEADTSGSFVDGLRILAGINSVRLRSLNGGAGLGGNTTLRITDRSGSTATLTIDEDASLSDVLDQINAASAIDVVASINNAGSGLLITDVSGGGGNLIIHNATSNAAAELGIDTGASGLAADQVVGRNLQLRSVAEGSKLTALNYGRGVGTGSFRIIDGTGSQATIDIGEDAESFYDIIEEINAVASSLGVDVTARVNDDGDGLILENAAGTGYIRVENVTGSTARDLGILGQASAAGGPIDGSYEKKIALDASDTLREIVEAIADSGAPVVATLLDSGTGPTPFRLSFTSRIAGASGELTIDARGAGGAGADLGLTTLTKGADAQILFGSGDPAQGLLIERPSNTLTDVLPGVTIELHDASDEPVSLTISRDTAAISKAVKGLVTAFNDAIGTIDEYDSYDAGTQSRGPLLGSPTTSRVRAALLNLVQGPALGIDGRFSRLADVGIGLGPGSELVLDEAAFLAAYEEDPDSVEELFTAFEASSTSVQEIAPGVTISRTEQEFTSLGFAELLDRLLDDLTHSLDGTLTLADRTLQDQIDLTNERIEDFDERLEARREQLRREFAAMESALARLHLQSQALQSLAANVAAAQGLL